MIFQILEIIIILLKLEKKTYAKYQQKNLGEKVQTKTHLENIKIKYYFFNVKKKKKTF